MSILDTLKNLHTYSPAGLKIYELLQGSRYMEPQALVSTQAHFTWKGPQVVHHCCRQQSIATQEVQPAAQLRCTLTPPARAALGTNVVRDLGVHAKAPELIMRHDVHTRSD